MSDEFNGLDALVDESIPAKEKLALLTQFKGHVKKTLVSEQMCMRYFENLSRLLMQLAGEEEQVEVEDERMTLFQLAHSAMCYLVKRVAMQAQYKFQHDVIELVVCTLLAACDSCGSGDKKVWQSSVKALEAIYLAKPHEFSRVLDECVAHKESIRTQVLLVVDELARSEINNGRSASNFVQKFMPVWVHEMNTNPSFQPKDVELIFDIAASRCPDVVVRNMVDSVMNKTASRLLETKFTKMRGPGQGQGQGQSIVATSQPVSRSSTPMNSNGSNAQPFDIHTELQSIMNQAPQFPSVPTPAPTNYSNFNHLLKDLESILVPFQAPRETEQNWKLRQANVIKLRSIVLGNTSTEFPEKFLDAWREYNLHECVTKSALSLRTSLCTQGCSLVKDLCSVFNAILDISIIDNLWSCMAKLMANTKKIANQNAYICLITLLSTVPFHSRLFNHCLALIRDKNTASRLYSSTFLRILIVRFPKRLVSQHHVYVEEWLQKGLTDAQTTIRETMRITFWYWYKISPMSGKKLLGSFQPQIKRALESSIPAHLDIDYDSGGHLTATTTAGISTNSRNSSRRSSLLPKRFPSYAAPTQSSHLPRSSIKRSLTDISHANSFSKRSLRTPPDHEMHIDLTNEITKSHTNPLLNRYMRNDTHKREGDEKAEGEEKQQSEREEEHLVEALSRDPKHGLELLQKYLLSDINIENSDKLQFSIMSLIRTNPKLFKPLLHFPKFYELIPLKFSMILLPLNHLDITMIESQVSPSTILNNVITILQSLEERNSEWSIFYVRFKFQIYNFCFETIERMLSKVNMSDTLINELLNACGKDMDAEKYYSLILKIYSSDKNKFTALLKLTPTASTKLKIANEIQKKDPDFEIKNILNNYRPISETVDPPEEKHLLEMTMVNPLEKRTVSTNTVVHNSLDSDIEENEGFERQEVRYSNIPEVSMHNDDDNVSSRNGYSIEPESQAVKQDPAGEIKETKEKEEEEEEEEKEEKEEEERARKDQKDDEEHDDHSVIHENLESVGVKENYQTRDSNVTELTQELLEKASSLMEESDRHKETDEPNGFTKFGGFSKLTEMTKVHSVFQPEAPVNENIDYMDVDSQNDSNLGHKSMLSDIFLKNQTNEDIHTSKEFGEINSNKEHKLDYESHMLTEAINDMEIKTNTEGSVGNKSKDDIVASQPIDKEHAQSHNQYTPLDTSVFPHESLILFELNFIDSYIETVELNKLNSIVHSITNNGTFKMNELQYLLKCFLTQDDEVLQWIHTDSNLTKLYFITEQLLSSSSSESHIPTNIAYKSLILAACLILINEKLDTRVLKNENFSNLIDSIIFLVAKLDTYDNEIYFASGELRQIMLDHVPNISTAFLERCLTALANMNEQYMVKVSYILQSIGHIVKTIGKSLTVENLKNLSNAVSKYAPSDVPEWRFESCTVLSIIYAELLQRNTPVGYIRSLMPLLDASDFEVVRRMSLFTSKDASRHLG